MRTVASALLVLPLVTLGGCATSRSGAAIDLGPAASDYAPLAVGSEWTYAVHYPGQQGEMTVKLVGEKDGYFVDDRDGAFRHTPDGLRDRQRYLIRTPLTAGATWKTVVSASAVEHNRIVSVGERCDSAAGAFPDCVVVESTIRRDEKMSLVARWTWAKGVGLVKLETEADIAGKGRVPQVKQSLVRYALATGQSGGRASAQTGDQPETRPKARSTDDAAPEKWEK